VTAIDLGPLGDAAKLMLDQHDPSCPDREFWETFSAWLLCVEFDERYGEPETAPRVRERTTALDLAERYLTLNAPAETTMAAPEVTG
jgi:hypothetical protein